MSVKYIGRVTSFKGKRLYELLCRLKHFGIGRIVARQVFNERYEEPSYYVITKVEPDMSDPTLEEFSTTMRGRVFGKKVFRGEDMGEKAIHTAYKADWRLIPKHEEQTFLNYNNSERQQPTVPRMVPLPPLLQHFIALEMKKSGQKPSDMPQLQIRFNKHSNNRAVYEEENNKAESQL